MTEQDMQDRVVSLKHLQKAKANAYSMGMDIVVKARIKELKYEIELGASIIIVSLSVLLDIDKLASNDYIPAASLLDILKRKFFADSFEYNHDVVVLVADTHAEIV